MDFWNEIVSFFSDYTLRTITLGTAVLGAASGMLGSFAVLRKQSLLGDAISHAALPGIALAFLITGVKDSHILLIGALLCGLLGTLWISGITKKTRLKTDTALGLVLSIFFGVGMLLLTYIQKIPDANQAGLEKYLFGQAATLLEIDVYILLIITTISVFILLLFWKEFKILSFDADYAKTIGINTKYLDILLTFFIVLIIVLGLQTVGVVLMSALLLAPAAAARQWTNQLGKMVGIAAFIGAASGVLGTLISAQQDNLSTGPVIVLVAGGFVVFSFLFAPQRGWLAKEVQFRKNRNNLQTQKTLQFMYHLVKTHTPITHPHSIRILNNFHGYSKRSLKEMEEKKWIKIEGSEWSMTPLGFEEAKNLYNQTSSHE